MKSFKPGKLEARTISDQDFSVNHSGAGLGLGLSKATPPVNRKRQTSSSILPLENKKKQKHIINIRENFLILKRKFLNS